MKARALLALGMLVGGEGGRQRRLALVPGAIGEIMACMRQDEDQDCRQVASLLFKALVSCCNVCFFLLFYACK